MCRMRVDRLNSVRKINKSCYLPSVHIEKFLSATIPQQAKVFETVYDLCESARTKPSREATHDSLVRRDRCSRRILAAQKDETLTKWAFVLLIVCDRNFTYLLSGNLRTALWVSYPSLRLSLTRLLRRRCCSLFVANSSRSLAAVEWLQTSRNIASLELK